MPSNLHTAAITDVGRARANNEDAFGSDPARGLYVVCDGMGGRAAGEVASALVRDTVLSVFATQPATQPLESSLANAIQQANAAVCRAAEQTGREGMGSTLVAAAVQGSSLLIGNVGDSRAYLLRDGICTQITIDHSYINELVRTGKIRPEERNSPALQRFESVITRAMGAAEEVQPDFYAFELRARDVILLVSDGLSRYLNEARLAALVEVSDLEGSCIKLVAAANAAGGADNITCLLLRYDDQT